MNIYILRTKKLYSDLIFIFFYHRETGWNSRVSCGCGGCNLQVAGCRLQVAGCRLQVAGCRLQVACRIIITTSKKRCEIQEFLVNIYILRTKKLYSDPDFHIFYHRETGWNSRVSCGCGGCNLQVAGCRLQVACRIIITTIMIHVIIIAGITTNLRECKHLYTYGCTYRL